MRKDMSRGSDRKPTDSIDSSEVARVDRRTWMRQAGTVACGAAAGLTLPASARPAAGQAPAAAEPAATRVSTTTRDVVETTAGRVRGFTRNGVHIFRGIPYGDTTAGDNRFLPPSKPRPWTGVRSSTSWGPVSPHAPRAGWVNDEEQFLYQWDDGFASEDMLRVNVWTPAVNDSRRRPVLVWIHGGGFTSGSSQELRPYDGSNLALHHDAVLVSMNHRLNVFGFLDLSSASPKYASSANVGMLDLVLALEWVRDNIANFGGDPANVTIFGQSGGGRKVSTLLAMPSARGLFHRAAIFSGAHLQAATKEQSGPLGAAVLGNLGLTAARVDDLLDVPTDVLLETSIVAQRQLAQAAKPGQPVPNWGPVVDGTVLPSQPFGPEALALSAGIPLLIGNTYVEFGGGINNPTAHELTLEQLRERMQPITGARTGEAIEAYRRVFPEARPFEIWGVVQGTRAYRLSSITAADRKVSHGGAPAYMYWFGWKTPVLDGRPLAYHCQDLAFWFDNIDLAAQATGGTDDARSLASKMSGALVAFARTGDPNHSGLPEWPVFTATTRPTMVFENERVVVMNDPDKDARAIIA